MLYTSSYTNRGFRSKQQTCYNMHFVHFQASKKQLLHKKRMLWSWKIADFVFMSVLRLFWSKKRRLWNCKFYIRNLCYEATKLLFSRSNRDNAYESYVLIPLFVAPLNARALKWMLATTMTNSRFGFILKFWLESTSIWGFRTKLSWSTKNTTTLHTSCDFK